MEGKDRENKPKQRLKGLFGKEKKVTSTADVNEFLYGTPDKLEFPASAPRSSASQQPQLTRLNTVAAPRWPTAAEVQHARDARGRSASPKRSRKGLVVQFTDEMPVVIGYGGDFAESPTITLRNRAHTHPASRDQRSAGQHLPLPRPDLWYAGGPEDKDAFQPGPIRHPQSEHASIPESMGMAELDSRPLENVPLEPRSPSSFAARVQREMQADEGRAFMAAASNPVADELFLQNEPAGPGELPTDIHITLDELELNTIKNANIPPASLPTQLTPGRSPTQAPATTTNNISYPGSRPPATSSASNDFQDPRLRSATLTSTYDSPPMLSRSSTQSQGTVGDEALQDFVTRIMHLFTLFRLSTESVKPLTQCPPEEIIRTAIWWFLRGRMNLEATVRDRPASPVAQQNNFLVRQQAYADLAKAWWIIETVMPQLPQFLNQSMNSPRMVDIEDARKAVLSGLRKLAMSMTRNHFLPPEDAPLPQGLDNSIFVYDGCAQSFLLTLKQYLTPSISDALPLGDSTRTFHYGRLFADAVLMEEGEAQQYRFPVLLSLVRNRKEKEPAAIITNQSGTLSLCIQGDKSQGPTWEDVTWHVRSSTMDIKRLRGFLLRLHCAPQDFRTVFAIFEYQRATYLSLKPRQDEVVVFQSIVKTFQYFGQDPNATFPKELLPQCELKVFEKVLKDKSGAVGRMMHRGFRLSLVTSPSDKTLRGINQELVTNNPLQLGFLRGEDNLPALLMKIEDGQVKYTMVFTFEDVEERARIYAKLTATMLGVGESVVSENKIRTFSIASIDSEEAKCLKGLKWQSVRVINEQEPDLQNVSPILSKNLRIVMDFRIGNLIDRVNLGSGELKLRLGVSTSTELKIFRQPQEDMTISVSESQVPKDILWELAEMLGTIARSASIRTYTFARLEDLHSFQTALTGFTVIFDGLAASFNISRRRMVVPIYKKWDAATTRVQLVKREKTVQLVAFFENFAHGECMNFTLKSTDTFEHFGRSGKFSLRIVDAKFPLPKGSGEGESAVENGFVCIEQVEYPGEHDDITIVFDSDSGMAASSRVTTERTRVLANNVRSREVFSGSAGTSENCISHGICT
jgi:hypothetical protein